MPNNTSNQNRRGSDPSRTTVFDAPGTGTTSREAYDRARRIPAYDNTRTAVYTRPAPIKQQPRQGKNTKKSAPNAAVRTPKNAPWAAKRPAAIQRTNAPAGNGNAVSAQKIRSGAQTASFDAPEKANQRPAAEQSVKRYKAKAAAPAAQRARTAKTASGRSTAVVAGGRGSSAVVHRRVAVRMVEPKITTVRKKADTPFPIGIVFACLLCTVLFMFILYSMVEINEMNSSIQTLESTISALKTQKAELSFELDEKNNFMKIADDAVNRLGMVTSDQLSKQYLDMYYDDTIERASDGEEDEFRIRLGGLFRSLEDKINELIEYLS